MPKEAKNPIQSDLTLLDLLEGLKELDGAQLTELAEHVGTTKSTAHNHLSTLRQRGYIVKDEDKYYLGYRFLKMGEETRYRTPLYEFARPELEKLAEEVEGLVNLCTEENGEAVYLYRKQGDPNIRFSTKAGDRTHMHCVGIGKAILAHLPRDRVTEIVDRHGLPKRTEQTITDRDELRAELEEIRDARVAFDDEEYGNGLRCVAAPVMGPDERVLGGISVSGPSSRLQGEYYRDELPELVKKAANIIELNIKQY